MKHEKVLSRAFNSLIVVILAAVLTIAVFLVYGTFEKSTEADIFRYTHELEESVRRTSSVELRRYMLLLELGKSMGADKPDEDFAGLLEEKSAMLRAGGELPHMVSSIGYFFKDSPEIAFEYDFDSDHWLEVNEIFNIKDMDRGMTLYSGKGSRVEGSYMAVENSGGERVVFYKLDRREFIDNYVKEIIEAGNHEFSIEWLWTADDVSQKSIEEYFSDEPKRYHFMPFRILFGLKRDAEPLLIEIPGPFEMRKSIERIDEISEDEYEMRPGRPGFLDGGVF
ncbi:MAG TPA: hypothetical protein DCO79_03995, partial [Spirochaeta sp.]|nr:hypothetical protein [Spirochaeta sp.]